MPRSAKAPIWDVNLPTLSAAARDLPRPTFAVVDGAWFGNIPKRLDGVGLSHRSLFRDECDPEARLAGPWLVEAGETGEGETIEHVLTLVGSLPAVVFWSCPAVGQYCTPICARSTRS